MYSVLGDLFESASSSEIAAVAYLCEGRGLKTTSLVECMGGIAQAPLGAFLRPHGLR